MSEFNPAVNISKSTRNIEQISATITKITEVKANREKRNIARRNKDIVIIPREELADILDNIQEANSGTDCINIMRDAMDGDPPEALKPLEGDFSKGVLHGCIKQLSAVVATQEEKIEEIKKSADPGDSGESNQPEKRHVSVPLNLILDRTV